MHDVTIWEHNPTKVEVHAIDYDSNDALSTQWSVGSWGSIMKIKKCRSVESKRNPWYPMTVVVLPTESRSIVADIMVACGDG